MKTRLIDADKLIDSLRASMNHGCETFPVDLIVEAIEDQVIKENKLYSKEIHAYQNENGTYKVKMIKRIFDKEKYEIKSEIECADIHITTYATNNGELCSVTLKE